MQLTSVGNRLWLGVMDSLWLNGGVMNIQCWVDAVYLEAVDECNESTDEAAEQHGED